MKQNYYAIKCKSLDFFNKPFPAADDKEAKAMVRNCIYAASDSWLSEHKHDDAELFFVGAFDSDRGCYSGKQYRVCCIDDIPVPKKVGG